MPCLARFALLALLGACAAGCPASARERRGEQSASSVRRRLVRVHSVSPEEVDDDSPDAARWQVGDYVIERPGVRVLVGGLDRPEHLRGNVLEFTHLAGPERDRRALQVAPTVFVSGVEYRVRVLRFSIEERAEGESLRIEGDVSLDDADLSVAWELSLAGAPGVLSFSQRVWSAAAHEDVRFGARMHWDGAKVFVPGTGELRDHDFHHGSFAAELDPARGVLYGYAHTLASVRGVFEEHGDADILEYTEIVEDDAAPLGARKARYGKAYLVSSTHGMNDAARSFGHARGAPFGEAWAYLGYRPEGAHVLLSDGRERPLLLAAPDDRGRVVLPLVAGEHPVRGYRASALAFGHAPSDVEAFGARARPVFPLVIPRGGQLRIRVRDTHDRPLASRARVVAQGDTAQLALGPDHRASGAGDVIVMLGGDARVPVPPGRYQVVITHGPFHEASVTDCEVTDTYSPRIALTLAREVALPDDVSCDLHVHSVLSPDSRVSLIDRLTTLSAEDIDFAVPTDHNHVTDYAGPARVLELSGFSTVSGVEITTWNPGFGHFNAYPYPRDTSRPGAGAPPYQGITAHDLFHALHELSPDMVVQVNHPRLENGIGYFDVMHLDAKSGRADRAYSEAYDAIEVWNGFDLGRPEELSRMLDDYLAIVARGKRVAATGSSDSHAVRYQVAGYPRTLVRVGRDAREDTTAIVSAIKAGRAIVTSGPVIDLQVSGARPGEHARAQRGLVALSVELRAARWVPIDTLEIYLGTTLLHTVPIPASPSPHDRATDPALRFALHDLPVAVRGDSFLSARVRSKATLEHYLGRGQAQSFAFTNPVFVDADGDGQTPWTVTALPPDAGAP